MRTVEAIRIFEMFTTNDPDNEDLYKFSIAKLKELKETKKELKETKAELRKIKKKLKEFEAAKRWELFPDMMGR